MTSCDVKLGLSYLNTFFFFLPFSQSYLYSTDPLGVGVVAKI